MKMINKLTIILHLIVFLNITAQENSTQPKKNKKNSIWYVDLSLGLAEGESGGLMEGIAFNYQYKKNLFTLKAAENSSYNEHFFFYPLFFSKVKSHLEYSLLYGRRHVYNSFSFSYSAGVSHVKLKKNINSSNYNVQNSFGVPLEFNVRWFKGEKTRFRILDIIPVGKPTSFGVSTGFKLVANISKFPYIGLGLTLGLGKHKIYN
ncbi:hypothetical protein [Tenacibaculum jejuense]|uniref:Outer membrane protein beta-barrel domain-containing protein n=1 Tax=Tenacibaculum jejuense TaxID=584609 RepID=A0A238UEY0_9FLAO|nr:hypothetical protein [Tenacibaculum jejuense]SNR17138.1 Protein of unknown function [Tenacibaculum jejuense]